MKPLVGVCGALLAMGLTGAVQADTLYRCKAYTGGQFWSRNPCQQHGALVDQIVPVPDGLPFATQVRLAEQAPGVRPPTPGSPNRKDQQAAAASATKTLKHQARCDKLRDQIASLKQMQARQVREGDQSIATVIARASQDPDLSCMRSYGPGQPGDRSSGTLHQTVVP